MGKLNNIDKAAEGKGSGINTLWQFVKFIVVSLGACIVQFGLVNILPLIFRPLYDSPCDFFVFHYPAEDGGWGYFWVFAISNITAQIVAFFINKEKTFNSGANTKVVLPIYIVFTVALICFSQWLNPTIYGWILNDIGWSDAAARNIATAVCSALQFFLYFPVDKILFHKKKEEKTEEKAAENEEAPAEVK